MKLIYPLAAAALASLLLSTAHAQQALTIGPKHRYRFDNASGSLAAGAQVLDSVGTAHGVVRGAGASATGSGIRLLGGSSATAAYLDFPNARVSGSAEIFPGFSDATYEVWITVHSTQAWARILDFGGSSVDEVANVGGTFNGSDYLMVSAAVGTTNNIRFERGGDALFGGATQDIAGATTVGVRMHIAATYDTASSSWKLYKNGTQIASIPTHLGPSTIDDLNVWLGRSNWSGDNNTDATYDEFRIYDYALNAQQVLGNYQAGPDVITQGGGDLIAPVFNPSSLTGPNAGLGVAYSASIAGTATDATPGDSITYSKIGGPAWLSVSASGTLGGTPNVAGLNSFVVRATDAAGNYDEAPLSITVTSGELPAGWTGADIGSVGVAGQSSYASGTYTVSGSGADIWDTQDAFRYVSQTLAGDGEIRARITSQTNTDPWAKAGVMIRDGSGAGAVNALVALTPTNGFTFQSRATASGVSSFTTGPASNAAPNNWVRLVRSGALFTAYVSANGTAWTQVGTATLTMGGSVSVGLAVTSHNNTTASTAGFDNVIVTPFPSPWLSADIGTTGLIGSAEFYANLYTVKGAGLFGGGADSFRYVYQTLSGDGSIVARVSTLNNTGTSARVGIMIRDTLANNSRMAALSVTGSGAYKWERRTSTGGNVTNTNSASGTAPNIWIRLTRSGNTITAAKSTNGTSWTTINSVTITMASNCYVGLAVAGGSTTTLNTSVFGNVTVVP
jgi:regulation of enolase protein 1 (concanavalin A-like superfamily)